MATSAGARRGHRKAGCPAAPVCSLHSWSWAMEAGTSFSRGTRAMADEGRAAWPALNQPLEMLRHLRNGWRLEKAGRLELEMRDVVDMREDVREPGESHRPTRRNYRGYRPLRRGEISAQCSASTSSRAVRGATKVCCVGTGPSIPNFAARPTRYALPAGLSEAP